MLKRLAIFACFIVAYASYPASAGAQQESRSWLPRIFSGDDTKDSISARAQTKSSGTKSAEDSSWWLPWKSEDKPKAKSSRPVGSAIGRMGRTTKKWWENSVDFINPFNDAPKPPPQQGYVPQNEKKKASSGGFFSWLAPPEEKRIESVNDFLSLPMPE